MTMLNSVVEAGCFVFILGQTRYRMGLLLLMQATDDRLYIYNLPKTRSSKDL